MNRITKAANRHLTIGKQHGFSLIEIMVVVVIIGILAAIVVPRIINRPEQARIVKAKQDIAAIEEALDLYKLDNGNYPTTDQGLRALVTPPTIPPIPQNFKTGGYLRQIPYDPWGRRYQYINPGQHNPTGVDVYSFGPNGPGATGGDGGTGIIGNWQPEKTTGQG